MNTNGDLQKVDRIPYNAKKEFTALCDIDGDGDMDVITGDLSDLLQR